MSIARNKAIAWLLVLGLLAPAVSAQRPIPVRRAQAVEPEAAAPSDGINVLILGDSLALCGFGKRLDDRFRKSPRVKATFTYLTCGTNPLSWLKERPYAHVQTHCGFWSIESLPNTNRINEVPDVYGMTRGHRPKSHPVPKLEDLLATIQPDLLVMQTGGGLFGLFSGRAKVKPERDALTLRKYIVPFIEKATAPPSKVRKIYWVSPPMSGRVSGEVQAFVFDQTQHNIGGVANVIDSRTLVSYPYQHMEPDKEHFIGEDMNTWADRVFEFIDRDLAVQSWSSLKPLSSSIASTIVAVPSASPSVPPPPSETPKPSPLVVRAKLVSKSKPVWRSELLPYQEFLVGFIYDVQRVIAGEYSEKQILVMHPAYIGLRKQSLGKYRPGRTYQLQLREIEGTIWHTVKSRDDSHRIDLQPYIRIQDEARYPKDSR